MSTVDTLLHKKCTSPKRQSSLHIHAHCVRVTFVRAHTRTDVDALIENG